MSAARYLRDAAVFAPCYIALDWASYIDPVGPFAITPWNPQPALAIVWMMLGGLHHVPVVLATAFVADVLIRQAPAGYAITLLTSSVLAFGYLSMAWALHRVLGDRVLGGTRQLTMFVAVVAAGTALVGAAFVGTLHASGLLTDTPTSYAWLRFWLGDVVGILVTAPLLLAVADAACRARVLAWLRRPESWLQGACLVATLWLIFEGLGGDPARHFYLLFVPLIWIAVRGGMEGAVLAAALVQVGVVVAIHGEGVPALPVIELQALVAAFTLTGLFLGVTVNERQRAAEELRESLRLAAAGEMAGAIAHEVNQPLTALATYGQAALQLLARGPREAAQVPPVIERMLREADRAAEIVRRLRDFFRAGTTRLESVPVADLLAAVRRIGQRLIDERPIELELREAVDLPALYIDRLQVELVLRNLLANAVDAVALAGRGRIGVEALREAEAVRFIVTDSGPGVGAEARERLFEPFVSGKPSGMGLGLAVSRAIAEAHGGSLEVRAAGRGEFHLVLPCLPA